MSAMTRDSGAHGDSTKYSLVSFVVKGFAFPITDFLIRVHPC